MPYSNYCVVFILISTLYACSGPQEPTLVRMENYKVDELNIKNVSISADCVYFNPNAVGLTIDDWDIDVFANGIEVAKVEVDIPTKIPPNGNFTIPIKASFPPSKVLDLKSGILTGLISAFNSKEIEMQYQGHLNMNVLGATIRVPIDNKEIVNLKK